MSSSSKPELRTAAAESEKQVLPEAICRAASQMAAEIQAAAETLGDIYQVAAEQNVITSETKTDGAGALESLRTVQNILSAFGIGKSWR